METAINRLFDSIDDLRERATADAAFGAPIEVEGYTLIPVAQVGYTFGLGFGGQEKDEDAEPADEGSGGGGGAASTRPLAMVKVTPDGVQVQPVVDEQKLAIAGALLGAWITFWVGRTLAKIFGN